MKLNSDSNPLAVMWQSKSQVRIETSACGLETRGLEEGATCQTKRQPCNQREEPRQQRGASIHRSMCRQKTVQVMWIVESAGHETAHEARGKSSILARNLLLFNRGHGHMKSLRGREADEVRCHYCRRAALCLGFSVVQYINQTDSTHSSTSKGTQTSSLPTRWDIWSWMKCEGQQIKPNLAQLHPFLRFCFVHICIQLYFLANLLILHVGFISSDQICLFYNYIQCTGSRSYIFYNGLLMIQGSLNRLMLTGSI